MAELLGYPSIKELLSHMLELAQDFEEKLQTGIQRGAPFQEAIATRTAHAGTRETAKDVVDQQLATQDDILDLMLCTVSCTRLACLLPRDPPKCEGQQENNTWITVERNPSTGARNMFYLQRGSILQGSSEFAQISQDEPGQQKCHLS